MAKAIVMTLLAIVSGSAVAEWVEIGGSEIDTTYVDPATIRKEGNRVKMWTLVNNKTPKILFPTMKLNSVMQQSEYDCKKEQERTLAVATYSDNVVNGEVVLSRPYLGTWTPVVHGTIDETLWRIACGKQ